MATTVDEIKDYYPIPAYQYMVTGIAEGDQLAFSEVSGLVIQYQHISYADGLGWKYAPGIQDTTEVTLAKGVIKGQSELFNWINSIKHNTVEKKDLTISLIANTTSKDPLISWKLKNTFPTKLDCPTFNASNNEVAIETLTLLVEGIDIKYSP
ncbi:MAG: phage tail protein [Symploca sp. SIO1B1]|nr:phage tail protein [Symploca sp. SIO2D2]NER21524.1 phage tail protein [Symploca sp. SIO1C2]NER96093.1 phage tail protein [Symploca sp. SIO1B1]